MRDQTEVVHENFLVRVRSGELPSPQVQGLSEPGLAKRLIEIFKSQVLSRQLDLESRRMQARGEGFYTIGSSGHEGNAALAAAFRPDDMAFLHYRDAAFLIQRSKAVSGQTALRDLLLSFAASSEDPISGGRHKVLGSKSLWIPPQTSTIASHLPKAVGTAFSIGLARRLGERGVLAADSLVLCSFGDASVNHSTAQGAFNTAAWISYQKLPLPLVFICEDNGLGISTRTPAGWIQASFSQRPGIRYFHCDGLNMLESYQTARAVAHFVRVERKPVFLHMRCVRLFGHAGADVQSAYLNNDEITAMEALDPLLTSAGILLNAGLLRSGQLLDIYQEIGEQVASTAREVAQRPKLTTLAEVESSLIPPNRVGVRAQLPATADRERLFGKELEMMGQPQHMAKLINWALADLMLTHSEIVLAGEDIGPKGGVYNVTGALWNRFGSHRVINTLLDEQSILGLAIGLAHNGILPIVEIQFLAYLHNAEDQLRGEAATLSFFSDGQFTNPMLVRIAGLGYQKGFGGHFHNDNSLAVLRDIPGLVIACPSNGADAVEMLRECVRLVREEQRVVVFLEPIALYMSRDLHQPGDNLWKFHYRPAEQARPIRMGELGQYGDGSDICIISYGNGYYLARQAEKLLREKHGLDLRIIDLRWLAPLNQAALLAAVATCGCILIVDECRSTGSQSEALSALLHEQLDPCPRVRRLTAADCFIPLGPAATLPLPSRDAIIEAALELMT